MPTTKAKPKVGDLVEVRFFDHCEDGDGDALEFIVYGRVMAMTRHVIQVGCWLYCDPQAKGDHNERRYDIVRRAITSTRILK